MLPGCCRPSNLPSTGPGYAPTRGCFDAVGAHRARGRPRGLRLARASILAADDELGRVGVALRTPTVVTSYGARLTWPRSVRMIHCCLSCGNQILQRGSQGTLRCPPRHRRHAPARWRGDAGSSPLDRARRPRHCREMTYGSALRDLAPSLRCWPLPAASVLRGAAPTPR